MMDDTASLPTPTQGQLLPVKIPSRSSLTEPATPRTLTPQASSLALQVSPSGLPQLPRDGPHWYVLEKVANRGSQHHILELFRSMLGQIKSVVDQIAAMKKLRACVQERSKSPLYSGATSGPGGDGQGGVKSYRAPQVVDGSPGESRRAICRLLHLLEQARRGLDAAKTEANEVDIELRTLRQRNKSLTSRLDAEKEMVAYLQAQRKAQREKSQRNATAYHTLEGRVSKLHEEHQTQCRRYQDELGVQRYKTAQLSEVNHALQDLLKREQQQWQQLLLQQKHDQDRDIGAQRRKNEQLMETIRGLRQEQQHLKQQKNDRGQSQEMMAQKNTDEGLTRTIPALRRQQQNQQQRYSQEGPQREQLQQKQKHNQGWQVSAQARKRRESTDTIRILEQKQRRQQQQQRGEWRLEELLQKQLHELGDQKRNRQELFETVSRLKQQQQQLPEYGAVAASRVAGPSNSWSTCKSAAKLCIRA